MRKISVVSTNVEEMWDYEYQAQNPYDDTILASNSLINLKEEIKTRGWKFAWISCTNGDLSYGQNIVSAYPYSPRY